MRKIHLHGSLGERFGETIELDVATAGEAVRALSINLPGFADALSEGAWEIVRGELATRGMRLDVESLNTFKLGSADLHFVPALAGAKEGGAMLKTVLGVAVVGASFAFSGGVLAAPMMLGTMSTGLTWGNMAMLGAGMALAGASSFLAPEETSKGDKDSSFTMGGPSSTYDEGRPVPLNYGEVIAGGYLISGGLDIEKIAVGS